VPREAFVPQQHRALAFSEVQIPIGEGERMWEPKLEARVLQELKVRRTDKVLEVGTGSGYLSALLAHRAARVVSVELKPALAALGRRNLERHGAQNVALALGDASHGWPDQAPYDVIVLTGSTPVLPDAFLSQLAPGGRLFAVVGEIPVMTACLVTCVAPGACQSTELFETLLDPLVNAEQRPRFRF
jgi:protein-L-isoaspartate(D-aspartate) O-methyltransferase